MALILAARKIIWMACLAIELGLQKEKPTDPLRADNQSAIARSTNAEFHRSTKHVHVAWHHIGDMVLKDRIQIDYQSTEATKSLTTAESDRFPGFMGM